jgi:hypothetical protein
MHSGRTILLGVVVALSCARPAEQRARAEADVGHAANGALRFGDGR